MSNKINKKDYSKKLNDRLGLKEILGREIDFTRLPLKDILDLNELFMDPTKIKKIAVNLGSEFLSGDLLDLAAGVLGGKPGEGGAKGLVEKVLDGANKDEVVETMIDSAEEELKGRFPIMGQIAAKARERLKARRKPGGADK